MIRLWVEGGDDHGWNVDDDDLEFEIAATVRDWVIDMGSDTNAESPEDLEVIANRYADREGKRAARWLISEGDRYTAHFVARYTRCLRFRVLDRF